MPKRRRLRLPPVRGVRSMPLLDLIRRYGDLRLLELAGMTRTERDERGRREATVWREIERRAEAAGVATTRDLYRRRGCPLR